MRNAYGSELLNLPIPLEAQYWNGSAFIRNDGDSCTSLLPANIGLANFTSNLAAGETSAAAVAFNAGVGNLTLSAPGDGNGGSVDLVINLGTTAIEAPCSALTPDPVTTGANAGHLQGKWCGANYDKDPTARATFGIRKTPLIYLRENF
jgi:MSHA biogenesis protein MshQ